MANAGINETGGDVAMGRELRELELHEAEDSYNRLCRELQVNEQAREIAARLGTLEQLQERITRLREEIQHYRQSG